MSRSTTSGRSDAAASIAEAPSTASPTTSNPSLSSSIRAVLRNVGWSSTTRKVVTTRECWHATAVSVVGLPTPFAAILMALSELGRQLAQWDGSRPRMAARTPLAPTYRGSCRRFSLVGEVAALRGGGRMLRRSQATCATDRRARGRRSRRGRRRHHGAVEAPDRARPAATRRSGDPGSRLASGLDLVPFGPCSDRVCGRDRGRHASPPVQDSSPGPCRHGRAVARVSRGSLLVGRASRKPPRRCDRLRDCPFLPTGPSRAATTRAESRTDGIRFARLRRSPG